MPRLINTDEDLGAVIGGLAKGAVGFSGYGAPETFTPGGGMGKQDFSFGQRLGRGIQAMQSDSVGEFLKEEGDTNKAQEAARYNAAVAKNYELKNEAENQPFDWGERAKAIDKTGKLFTIMEDYMKNSGADTSGNQKISEKEAQKALQMGWINASEIAQKVREFSDNTTRNAGAMKNQIELALGKLGEKPAGQTGITGQADSSVGRKVFSIEDFDNPEIAEAYPKQAKNIALYKALQESADQQTAAAERLSNYATRTDPATIGDLESKAAQNLAQKAMGDDPNMDPWEAIAYGVATVKGGDTLDAIFQQHTGKYMVNTSADELRDIAKHRPNTAIAVAGALFKPGSLGLGETVTKELAGELFKEWADDKDRKEEAARLMEYYQRNNVTKLGTGGIGNTLTGDEIMKRHELDTRAAEELTPFEQERAIKLLGARGFYSG